MSYTDTTTMHEGRGFGPDRYPFRQDQDGAGPRGFRYAAPRRDGVSWGSVKRRLRQGEAWLDERGRGAWIAAIVLGFIVFWPAGLALLAYSIWSKRMFRSLCNRTARSASFADLSRSFGLRSSGNSAFDAYRADTLRRLEDEQEAFQAFLERLRAARDKQEFDSFMEERAARAAAPRAEDASESDPKHA